MALEVGCWVGGFLSKAVGVVGFASRLCVGLKSLLRQGLLEPAFYGDLVYKLKKLLALVVFQLALLK